MDNISELLNSISPEDMEKLKGVAASLMNNNSNGGNKENKEEKQEEKQEEKNTQSSVNPLFSNDTTDLIMRVAGQMNKDNDTTAFIKALRPLLSEERRNKADEAMKFLRLMETLPLLKGLF